MISNELFLARDGISYIYKLFFMVGSGALLEAAMVVIVRSAEPAFPVENAPNDFTRLNIFLQGSHSLL